jgi:hypothetical protein
VQMFGTFKLSFNVNISAFLFGDYFGYFLKKFFQTSSHSAPFHFQNDCEKFS